MQIAIFGRSLQKGFKDNIIQLFTLLKEKGVILNVYQNFLESFLPTTRKKLSYDKVFCGAHDLPKETTLLISVGGDGTFLEAVTIVQRSNIPILGINMGRLGFLAPIALEEIPMAIEAIVSNNYRLESRTLLNLHSESIDFKGFPYALNEVTIQKKGSSMITIHVHIDNEYLSSYWADGLIIATPTGSTGYSLSVGGPIIAPHTNSFVISPISPHNLTVRPFVIPDTSKITIKVEGRSKYFLTSWDHREEKIKQSGVLNIEKANFKINVMNLNNSTFYTTLRNKLMWGIDKRN